MKLEVVPLPEQRLGEAISTPYLLVISEASETVLSLGTSFFDGVKEDIEATGVLVFEDSVEVVK